ncbi:MAG: hypothetical protein ACRDE2_16925, partial [Chitinophagaceae bacterium]
MKFFILNIIIVLTMIISSCNPSEKNPINQPLRFSWRIAGEIPPSPDGKPSPGLAGPVTGFSNNVFIVGGGANFPDGMPWNGGKKVYHNDIYIFKSEKDSLINNPQNVQLPFNLAYSANC